MLEANKGLDTHFLKAYEQMPLSTGKGIQHWEITVKYYPNTH